MAVAGSSEKRPGRSERLIPPARPTEPLPCPRCFSNATKFCYYNNHSIFQPRYFCKRCRLYWTHGGALRNVPVGGATRKSTKLSARPFCSSPAVAPTVWLMPSAPTHCPIVGAGSLLGYGYGSFASFMSEPAKYLTLGGYGTSLDWLLLMYPVIARRRTGGASGSSEVASAD